MAQSQYIHTHVRCVNASEFSAVESKKNSSNQLVINYTEVKTVTISNRITNDLGSGIYNISTKHEHAAQAYSNACNYLTNFSARNIPVPSLQFLREEASAIVVIPVKAFDGVNYLTREARVPKLR